MESGKSTVSLDLSRTFDKVWLEGPIFKLHQNDMSGNLRDVFHEFLDFRRQRALLKNEALS